MKKFFIAFLLIFIAGIAAYAQDETAATPESQEVSVSTYWADPDEPDSKLLNKTKFWDNWFLGIQGGTYVSWGTNMSSASLLRQIRPAGAIQVGKWFAPYAGARVQAYFGNNIGYADNNKYYNWNSFGAGIDGLFSFSNIFWRYKENRKLNFIGIIGVGYERTTSFSDKSWNTDCSYFSKENQNLISMRVGLALDYRISEKWDINLEVTNVTVDNSYDGIDDLYSGSTVAKNNWDGHVNVLIGVTYRFKNHDGSRQFTYAKRRMGKYDALNSELTRLRAEKEEALNKEPEVITKVQTEVVKSNRFVSYISFDTNSSKIDGLQELNVYSASKNWKKTSEGDIYITSTNEVKDSDLFHARAQSIRDVLANTYNIPAGHIFIEKNPAVVSSLDPQKDCVIVYINE